MNIKELEELISAFRKQKDSVEHNETLLRSDFITPLLKLFGWDVDNTQKKTQFLRDVLQEEPIDVDDEGKSTKKRPDYSLRISGNTKFFIEVKKASIDIENLKRPAFQTKRYGWNANLGISILTNFETLIVYDCRFKPDSDDQASVARHKVFHFEEFISKIDELIELLSFESVSSGFIEKYFALTEKDTLPFDSFFLSQIEKWRESLAQNILKNNKTIDEESINFLIQRLLNRIIFLRICEDREIEKYETLKAISNYDELKALFVTSDKKYNSGLFDFIEDNLSLSIHLDEQLLIDIFEELYYPASPYDFSVIDPLILSQIYEQYLGSRIALVPQLSVQVVQEPEVVASNGVVPTPKLVVGEIISETLQCLFSDKSFDEIRQLKIADICCGSGTFLITLYDHLIQGHVNRLIEERASDDSIIYEGYDNIWHLTLNEKRKILTDNIFGVDVNPYATEVTQFSLLLKLLENENESSIDSYLKMHKAKVLPKLTTNIKCGNSLVDDTFHEYDDSAIDDNDLLYRIKPFDWEEEFPFLKDKGGFDSIVGNPPYVRIQNLVKYSLEEINYYRSKTSPYSFGKKDTFDKYYLFIERAIELINDNGVIGYIVPHKFFIVKGGKKLRSVITSQCSLTKIIHFGVAQVFPGRLTYTAIMVMEKQDRNTLEFKRISEIKNESSFLNVSTIEYQQENYSDTPWIFLSKEASGIFDKAKSQNVVPLKSIAEIPVGLQSSADDVYILHPTNEDEDTITIEQDKISWQIEKEIVLPCLHDVRLNLFDTPKANSFIIFPYTLEDGKAIVYSEEIMSSQFPLCWKYLNHHKTRLSKRSINGSKDPKWYQFGRSQSLTKFHSTDKLIWKVLSMEASYTFDNSNVQFTGGGNGPYYSLISKGEYSLFYILALLSHPLIEAMVKSGASEFQGDYYSHGKQFIENVPIRAINFDDKKELDLYKKVVNDTQDLVKTKEAIRGVYLASKKSVLMRKYDKLRKAQIELISSLYNISESELSAVSGDNLFYAEIDKGD